MMIALNVHQLLILQYYLLLTPLAEMIVALHTDTKQVLTDMVIKFILSRPNTPFLDDLGPKSSCFQKLSVKERKF